MANPFDEAINLKEERKELSGAKKPRDAIHVSFSISRRIFIHAAYILVILVLLFFVFKPEQEPVKAAAPPAKPANLTAITPAVEEAAPVAPPPIAENVTNATNATAAGGTLDDLNFAITGIDYLSPEGKPLKMSSITYTIFNGYKDFTPLVKIYWYDRLSTNETKNRLRVTSAPGRISKGATLPVTVDKFAYGLIDQGETKEIVVARLFDYDTNEMLKEQIKEIP